MQNVHYLNESDFPHVGKIANQIGVEPSDVAIRITYNRVGLKKNGADGIDVKADTYIEYTGSEYLETFSLVKEMSATPKEELRDAFKVLGLHYCIAMGKISEKAFCSLVRTYFEANELEPSVHCGIEQRQHHEIESDVFQKCEALAVNVKGESVILEVLWGNTANTREAVEKSVLISENDYPYFDDLKFALERLFIYAHNYAFRGDYRLPDVQLTIVE